MDLAAFSLLLRLDLVERELEVLEDANQDASRGSVSGERGRSCQCHACLFHNSGIRTVERHASLERYAQRFRELRRGIEQIEYFGKGTVLKRRMKCGKARRACASDPAKRHGPYFELTYKANDKTVNVKLSPEAVSLDKAAAQQYRKLKTLLNRLDKLSKPILRHRAKQAQSKHQN